MWCPSESSVWLLGPRCLHLGSSSQDWLLVQSSSLAGVSPLLVKRSHFAVGRFLGCVVFQNRRASLVTFQFPDRALSSSCASVQSVTQPYLANRSQPVGSSHGLLFPTAHTGSEVRFTRVCPPATFRLQGLATLLTAYTLSSLAGFVSHRQHSWDSPFGAFSSRKVSGAFRNRMNPHTVLPIGAPAAGAMGRPNRPRFLGFDPSESPWRSTRV